MDNSWLNDILLYNQCSISSTAEPYVAAIGSIELFFLLSQYHFVTHFNVYNI